MSHVLNIIQKTDVNKSVLMLIQESRRQNSKIKIRKNEIVLNSDNQSRLVFYLNTKTLLRIEDKNHSSFNFYNNLNSLNKQINLINTPINLKNSLVPSVKNITNLNKKVKVKEVQLSVSRTKSRIILEKTP